MSNYSAALQNLNKDTWQGLQTDEKLAVLQAIERETAAREGRRSCDVRGEYIPSSDDGVVLGYYNRETRLITINTEQLDPWAKYGSDYQRIVETVLHEGRHAYQHQAVAGEIEHDDKEELAAWTENMKPDHYITHKRNPRGYYNQPIERDARNFAEERLRVVEREKAMLFPDKQQEQELSAAGVVQSGQTLRGMETKSVEERLEDLRNDLQTKGVLDRYALEATIEREKIELQQGTGTDAREIEPLRGSERLLIETQEAQGEQSAGAYRDARAEIDGQIEGGETGLGTETGIGADRDAGRERDSGVSY